MRRSCLHQNQQTCSHLDLLLRLPACFFRRFKAPLLDGEEGLASPLHVTRLTRLPSAAACPEVSCVSAERLNGSSRRSRRLAAVPAASSTTAPPLSLLPTGDCGLGVRRLGRIVPLAASVSFEVVRLNTLLWYSFADACRVGFAGPARQTHTHTRRPHALQGVHAGHPRALLIGPPYSTWWYCGCPGTKRLSCRPLLLLLLLRRRDKDKDSRLADQSGIEVARRCNTARYHPGTFDTGRVEDARDERLNIFISICDSWENLLLPLLLLLATAPASPAEQRPKHSPAGVPCSHGALNGTTKHGATHLRRTHKACLYLCGLGAWCCA